ncbi:MAG: rRNA maturation RNase YbeY [Cyclobacteriaceae bacterium]|nr:rRNA maturation RNase YbeY [Cyclobacteriaceae bacterium]
MKQIRFFIEDTTFQLRQKNKLRLWITDTIENNNKQLLNLNYIFTSDQFLLDINRDFLHHDTYTDIITFDQSSDSKAIEADIYISIDRIKENAANLQVRLIDELHRVMIHGVLHLLGYKDKSESQKREMRKKEDHYLALRNI